MLLHKWKVHKRKIEIVSFVVKFYSCPHCQFLGVGQGMISDLDILWHPLYQIQSNGRERHRHQTLNYAVKVHRIYRGTWKYWIRLVEKGSTVDTHRNADYVL